jgi:hypothetical protein
MAPESRYSLLGAVVGAVVGAGVGYGVSRAVNDDGRCNEQGWAIIPCVFGEDTGTVLAVALGAVLGAALGSQVKVNRMEGVPIRLLPVVRLPANSGMPGFGVSLSLSRPR